MADCLYGQVGRAPGNILSNFDALKTTWLNTMVVAARRLFGILAAIEFAWAAALLVLDKTDLQSWTSALIKRIMFIGAYFALLLNGRDWIDAIIKSFTQLGATASGLPLSGMAPGQVFDIGLQMASLLADTADTVGWLDHFATALALTAASLVVLLAYVVITLTYIVTMIESYICVAAGYIFLGFGGSRWTAPYVERYLSLTVAIGVKLMCLYLIIGGGIGLTNQWLAAVRAFGPTTTIGEVWDIVGSSILFMGISWMIPKFAASLLGGAPNFTAGDAVSPVATVATVGATAVMATTALAGRGLSLFGGGNNDAMPVSKAANPGGGNGSSPTSGQGAPGGNGGQPGSPSNPPPPGGSKGSGGTEASNGAGNVGSNKDKQPSAPNPALNGSSDGGSSQHGTSSHSHGTAPHIAGSPGANGSIAGQNGGMPSSTSPNSTWGVVANTAFADGTGFDGSPQSSPNAAGMVPRVPPPQLTPRSAGATSGGTADTGASGAPSPISHSPNTSLPTSSGAANEVLSVGSGKGSPNQVPAPTTSGKAADSAIAGAGPGASLLNPQTISNPQTTGSLMKNSSPMTVSQSGQVPPPSALVKGLQLTSTAAALSGLVIDRAAAAVPGETPPSVAATPLGTTQDE